MCGRCRNVFNAFESLKRIEDEEQPIEFEPAESAKAETDTGKLPQFPALDIGSLRELAPEAPPEFTATDATEFAPELEQQVAVQSELIEAPRPETDGEPAGKPPLTSAPSYPDAPAFLRVDLPPNGSREYDEERPAVDDDNPLLRPSYQDNPSPRTAIWLSGIGFLLIVMLVQGIYFFRTSVIETYPQTRSYMAKACEFLGCVISWGRDEAAIKIEASDLIESPVKPGRILLTATLVNRGKAKQELPAIEVRLTDNNNQVLASRILQPQDYLGRTRIEGEGLTPNAELFVNMNFEIANKSPASGYGLRAFYP